MIFVYNLYGEGKYVINGEEVKVSLFDFKK